MTNNFIHGSGGGGKRGKGSSRTPNIARDTVASNSVLKILLGLSEGEVEGLANTEYPANSITLDGTPLVSSDGRENFPEVGYEFVSGTNDQEYIKGFPSLSREQNVGVELTSAAPWIRRINDTQLSAVRVRFRWNALSQTDIKTGDVGGYKIDYKIELQTGSGAYKQVLKTSINDKTSAGYERTHRIDLPKSDSGWQIRVTRITPNADSDLIQDTMFIDAIAEVIDAKLRYPNTAMIALTIPAKLFSNVPKVAVRLKGVRVLVPNNYNPMTRVYNGVWNGGFIESYTDNPAWIYYALCTNKRFGLGGRVSHEMVDKWSVYQLGRYCDELVPNGEGGEEPRFTCNIYLQKREEAYKVLQSIASVFRSMSFWQGEQIVLSADLPKDPVYAFTNANIEGGIFNYTGTRARDRHTVVKVAWDNPANEFKTEYEFIRDEAAIAKHGIKVLDIPAFGCTSRGQAQRAGKYALASEQTEIRQVSFTVGLDGFVPQVGDVVSIADNLFAGAPMGGRVTGINGSVITLDRQPEADIKTLVINGANGVAESRKVVGISGNNVTVSAAFENAEIQNVWAASSDDLQPMTFRILQVTKSDDSSFSVIGLQHEPQKFEAADFGANISPSQKTKVKPIAVNPPESVSISSRSRVSQGQNITTLVINWQQVEGAEKYIVQWRKDNGTWINLPVTTNVSAEVEGVYSGVYEAKVSAVNAVGVESIPTKSSPTNIEGKAGKPLPPVNFKAESLLFGIRLEWSFPQGAEDTAYTEIECMDIAQGGIGDFKHFGMFAYPSSSHEITGLQADYLDIYRARLVDKLGNASDWSEPILGQVDSSPDKVLDLLDGQIQESHLYQSLSGKIDLIPQLAEGLQDISEGVNTGIQEVYDQIANLKFEGSKRLASVYKWYFNAQTMQGEKLSPDYYTLPEDMEYFNYDEGRFYHLNLFNLEASGLWWFGDGLGVPQKPRASLTLKWPVDLSNPDIEIVKLRIRIRAASSSPSKMPKWSSDNAIVWGAGLLDIPEPEFGRLYQSSLGEELGLGIDYATDEVTLDVELPNPMSYSESMLLSATFGGEISKDLSLITGYFITSIELGYEAEGNAETMILDERIERQREDSLIRADVLSAYNLIDGHSADITNIRQVQSNDRQSTATQISELKASNSGLEANITDIRQVQANDRESTATQISELKAVNQNQSALIFSTAQASLSRDNAIGERIDTIQAEFDDNLATHQQQLTANANAISAEVTARETLQVTVNGQKTSIQTLQSVTSEYGAQYSVKLDNNGRATGFGLLNQKGQPTQFAVVADNFYIAGSGAGNGIAPFQVLTSSTTINGVTVPAGTYIKSAQIANGSISNAKIGNAAITEAKIGKAAITEAKIKDLSVDTVKIKDGAVTVTKAAEGGDEWSGITRYYADSDSRSIPSNAPSYNYLVSTYAHIKPYVMVGSTKRAARAKISRNIAIDKVGHYGTAYLYTEECWVTAVSTTFTNNHNATVPFNISAYFDHIVNASRDKQLDRGEARTIEIRVVVNDIARRRVKIHADQQVEPKNRQEYGSTHWDFGGFYSYFMSAIFVELPKGTHTAEVQVLINRPMSHNDSRQEHLFEWKGAAMWVQGVKK